MPAPPDSTNITSPAWAELLTRLEGRRVVTCIWFGMPAFGKRLAPRHAAERVLTFLCATLLRRWLAGFFAFKPATPYRDAPFEVQRLRELRQLGERVPRVLACYREAFVVEPVGISLEHLLARCPPGPQRDDWVDRASEDLARFHGRGHWHGGAQIRNVGVSAQGLARFDFDRELDRHFPLPMLQALDAVLFLSSLASLASLHDEGALGMAARSYFSAAPQHVLTVIRRVAPTVDFLARSSWLRRLAPKEAARVRALAAAVSVVGACPRYGTALRPHPTCTPSS